MTFTKQLYERICEALPHTTSRSFSRYCGKSEGYYGSICAQQLPISINALIYLAEIIEHNITHECCEPRTAQKLRQVQKFIAAEIARRTHEFPIDNMIVRKMIISAVAHTAYAHDHRHNLPPIILG